LRAKVAIVGAGGQVASAAASIIAARGFSVFQVYIPRATVGLPNRAPRLRAPAHVSSLDERRIPLELSRRSVRTLALEHVRDADIIILALPSYLMSVAGRRLAMFAANKIVVNLSERFLGTSKFIRRSTGGNNSADPAFSVHLMSPPFLAYANLRLGGIQIISVKRNIAMFVDPPNMFRDGVAVLRELFGCIGNISPISTALDLALHNTHSIAHAVRDLSSPDLTPTVHAPRLDDASCAKAEKVTIARLVNERDNLRRLLIGKSGQSLEQYEEFAFGVSPSSSSDGLAGFRNDRPEFAVVSARPWYAKHGFEDVACSLVPVLRLARTRSIAMPFTEELVQRWERATRFPFRLLGRTAGASACSEVTI
jgi:hypothetical protein